MIRQRLPKHIRRVLSAPALCHYRREQYRTSSERNARYRDLRHLPGIIKYSDTSVIGLVYVVAWPMPAGTIKGIDGGMTPANRKTAGGEPPYPPTSNFPKIANDPISM